MKWFLWFCLVGCAGSLLAWVLPDSVKPYHVSRWIHDFGTEFEEHVSEIGFGPSGLVRVRYYLVFSGGPSGALDRERQNWHQTLAHSTQRWPVDSRNLQYNDWGPNHYYRPDGLDFSQMGKLYLLPYSFTAIGFGAMFIIFGLIHLRMRQRIGILPPHAADLVSAETVSRGDISGASPDATRTPPGGEQ